MFRAFPERTLYKLAHSEKRSDWKKTSKIEEVKGKRITQRITERRENPRLKIEDTGKIHVRK